MKHSLDFLTPRFNSGLATDVLDVILAFLSAQGNAFSSFGSQIVPLQVNSLDGWKTANIEMCRRILL